MRSFAALAIGTSGLGLLLVGPSVTPWALATGGGLIVGLVLLRRAGRPDAPARGLAVLLAGAVVALTAFDGGAYLLPAALTTLVLEIRPIDRVDDPGEGDGPGDRSAGMAQAGS